MRPALRASLLCVTLTCLLTASAQPPAEKEFDWPGFLGPQGTSVSPEKGIIAPWPEKGLKLVWHKKLGTGYGAPSISKGKLYIFDRQENQARLTCLDARTGEFHWKYEYPTAYKDSYGYNNGPRCCPVIDGDRIYIYGVEGMLHCLKVKDGDPVWKVDTRRDFGVVQNFFGVVSTPVVEGDLLLVMVGGSPEASDPREFQDLKGNKSAVVAFDKMTGKVRYRISDELAGCAGMVVATINEKRLGLAFCRGGLLAFHPADGKIDFHFPWRAAD